MDYNKRQIVSEAAKSISVVAGLLAVVLLSSLLIVISAPPPDKKTGHEAIASVIFPGDQGSMVKNEPLSSGKSSFLSIPAVVGVQNYENLRPNSRIIEYRSPYSAALNRLVYLSKAALISPEKALEFTLVGAKPSGTS